MPFNLRKHLAAPLGLLIVCSLAVVWVVHFQSNRLTAGTRAIAEAAEPRNLAILEMEMEMNRLRVVCAAVTYARDRDAATLQHMRHGIDEFRRWARIHARHARSAADRSLAAEITRDFERLQNAANALVQADDTRVEKGAVLRRMLAELDGLLASSPTRAGDAAQIAAVGQMRHAANSVGTSITLLLNGAPEEKANSVQAHADSFEMVLALYRKRGALPRERAWATEIERRLRAIVELSAELRNDLAQHTSSWTELLRLRGQLDDKTAGGLQTAADRDTVSAAKAISSTLVWTRWALIALAGGSVTCGIAIVVFATRGIARPMGHLVEVARAITNGRTRHRASPEAAGNFRMLADAFNQMIEARQQAEEKLQLAHDSLELKVQARTIELWRANKALREETEQRAHAEREFQQAQKMDALGKLAGSIAHDFNNLLTVIIGGAECAQNQLGANHPAVSLLRTVQQAGERAAGLTRPLLTFSRNQVLALEPLNLNEAAEEASRMLHRLMGVNIEVKLQLEPELRCVLANANQLQQVLINLAVNARDAMEGMGVLTIATRNVVVDPTVARRNGLSAAEYWVELGVSDTGCGMDAATKARIFEPFFTTKPAGRGTGLGLSTVFGIIKQTGGLLNVESKVGEGTTFRVILPATTATKSAASVSAEPAPPKEVASGDETLLLVDDEEDIRELATITLEGRGYRILSAGNSEEAIVLGEKHAGEIRALITDVVMPGINGVQLAGVLSKIIPNLRVLFVSGHTNESISAETLHATRADYLQKPYLGETLAAKVRELLAKSASRVAEPRKERYPGWVN